MKPLTKTEFMRGIECEKRVWFDRYRPHLKATLSAEALDRIAVGQAVGELARDRYPGGAFMGTGDSIDTLVATHDCIFEARFEVDGRLAKVDALWKGENGWVIDEVKSSSLKEPKDLKRDKLWDLAFQYDTLLRYGLPVQSARLVMVDSRYIWDGGPYPAEALLEAVDVTSECERDRPAVSALADALVGFNARPEPPDVATNTHCKECDYFAHCHENGSPHDLIYLPGIRAEHVEKWRAKGYQSVDQIPPEEKMPVRQARMRDVIVSGERHVGEGLAEALDSIQFPAAFVDYETTSTAFPIYPGTRPYQQICFQWSCHWMDSPVCIPVHSEFLPVDDADPRAAFCAGLWEKVKDARAIVHYTGFEIWQLKPMVEAGIPFAAEILDAIQSRSVDLEKIVREHVYLEEFRGRTSIKVVLPALAPHMTYKDMAISDGNAAGRGFREMIAGSGDVAQLREDLLAYCKQDTLAMVEVFWALRRMAEV